MTIVSATLLFFDRLANIQIQKQHFFESILISFSEFNRV